MPLSMMSILNCSLIVYFFQILAKYLRIMAKQDGQDNVHSDFDNWKGEINSQPFRSYTGSNIKRNSNAASHLNRLLRDYTM